MSLSVVIMARDEEQNLPRCLASVRDFADQMVVIDSESTDRTREVAAEAGAEVHVFPWRGNVGQRKLTIEHATCDWVLCLDADEWLDEDLRRAMRAALEADDPAVEGYEVNRRVFYLGRWIEHCGWSPEWRLRLFRRGKGSVVGRVPHDHMVVDGPARRLPGRLNHWPYRSMSEHLGKVDRYTTEIAAGKAQDGERPSVARLVLRPPARFLRMYVLRAGFLDGWRGLVISSIGAYYVFLKYAKLLELTTRGAVPGGGDDGAGRGEA